MLDSGNSCFIRLANSTELVGYRDAEHRLLRPGSPGGEHPALLAHVKRWPGAVYLNLETDPGLYETWNLGCCLGRGRVLSNAKVTRRATFRAKPPKSWND